MKVTIKRLLSFFLAFLLSAFLPTLCLASSADDKLSSWLSSVENNDYSFLSEASTTQTPVGVGGEATDIDFPVMYASVNNSNFNISQVSWSTFPQYIKDILSIDYLKAYSDYSASSTAPRNLDLPFCLIRVGASNYQIWCGINLGIFTYVNASGVNTGSQRLGCVINVGDSSVNNPPFPNASCYTASFKISDNSVVSDWSKLSSTQWGSDSTYGSSMRRVCTYTGDLTSSTSTYDFYYYGAYSPYRTSNLEDYFTMNLPYGSARLYCRSYIFTQSHDPFYYINSGNNTFYFSPPSSETQAENTRQGIWATLKSVLSKIGDLPSLIIDKLKSFFVPSSNFFSSWYNSLNEYFEQHLGFVWQVISLPLSIIDTIKTSITEADENDESSGVLTFPALKVPKFDGTNDTIDLLPEQSIDLVDIIGSNRTLSSLWFTFVVVIQAFLWGSLCIYGYKVIKRLLDKEGD